jgi:competence protein ComFB
MNAFTVNLQETRKKYGPVVGQKNLVPLVLAPLLLYVPVKFRSPLVNGDPAYGYFRLRSILQIHDHPKPCILYLEGGHEVAVHQSSRTVRRRLRSTRMLEAHMLDCFYQTMDFNAFFWQTACTGVFPSWQEKPGFYGIIAEEKEKGEQKMELRNLMESLVMQRLDELSASEKGAFCSCGQCRMDIAALALNDLPPRYVVTQRGETYSKADILEIQRYVDVVSAVAKAVSLVQKKPRHECNL